MRLRCDKCGRFCRFRYDLGALAVCFNCHMRNEIFAAALVNSDFMMNDLRGLDLLVDVIFENLERKSPSQLEKLFVKAQKILEKQDEIEKEEKHS